MDIHPLTPDRWSDLEALFGLNGAEGGCWCMWWRALPKDYKVNAGEGNRLALKARVDRGDVTGLLSYDNGEAVGWVSVSPRAGMRRFERSTTWRPIDDQPVWAIVCFFVRADRRGKRVAIDLLNAAIRFAEEQGAQVIEAYPKDVDAVGNEPISDRALYWGTLAMYRRAGFVEVARRSPMFPIVRLIVGNH